MRRACTHATTTTGWPAVHRTAPQAAAARQRGRRSQEWSSARTSRRSVAAASASAHAVAREVALLASTAGVASDGPPEWTLDQIAGLVFGVRDRAWPHTCRPHARSALGARSWPAGDAALSSRGARCASAPKAALIRGGANALPRSGPCHLTGTPAAPPHARFFLTTLPACVLQSACPVRVPTHATCGAQGVLTSLHFCQLQCRVCVLHARHAQTLVQGVMRAPCVPRAYNAPPRMQGVMIASYFLAKYADTYVAAAQRQELGLCTKCGGLNEGDVARCPVEACPRRAQWSP